ncbi:MAG: hypothetical protein MJE77_43950 [Proteobacteria bacterium]|nr:hypothetical protein [Pseudomonadota bacterium]
MAERLYSRLETALRDRDAVLARWKEAFERSPLPMPQVDGRHELAPFVGRIVDGLVQALPAKREDGTPVPGDLVPGSPWIRELEQAVAFVGAAMAACGASGFDLTAVLLSLRDVLVAELDQEGPLSDDDRSQFVRLFEWLTAVCTNSWGTAQERMQSEKLREIIERDTPVLLLAPTVAAVTLVGAPDSVALDAIFARLILLVVRVGASAAIVDATGLEGPARPEVLDALGRLFGHNKVAGKVLIVAAGLSDETEELEWRKLARTTGTSISFEAQFFDALNTAHKHAGFRLVRA